MTGITRRLAEFAAGIDFAALEPDVLERTRMLLMDQVGICIRGRNDAGLSTPMAAALRHLGLGSGNASVIGDGAAYSPPAAALFNGNLGHSLDFDDTHASGSIHPSAPIVPAALAAAEMVDADGRTVIAAVVAGYEVQIRLSLALGPSDHYQQGLSSHRDVRSVRRGGRGGSRPRAGRVADGGRVRTLRQSRRRVDAVPRRRRMEQAVPYRLCRDERARGGLHGPRGIPRGAQRHRGSGRLPARLRPEREPGPRRSPSWASGGKRCASPSSRTRRAGTVMRPSTR